MCPMQSYQGRNGERGNGAAGMSGHAARRVASLRILARLLLLAGALCNTCAWFLHLLIRLGYVHSLVPQSRSRRRVGVPLFRCIVRFPKERSEGGQATEPGKIFERENCRGTRHHYANVYSLATCDRLFEIYSLQTRRLSGSNFPRIRQRKTLNCTQICQRAPTSDG